MQDDTLQSPAPKKPRFRRILRCSIIGLMWFVTLVALLVVEENWRGKRAWEKYKAEMESKGENLDWENMIPPPVPDEQNFAQTPFLAPLFDYDLNHKAGESAWRDTNGFARVGEFASDFPSLKIRDSWWEARMTDLPARFAAFSSKSGKTATSATALSRSEAAAQILKQMENYKPVLDELQEASKRPYSRFKVHYEDYSSMLMPHLGNLKRIAQIYQMRASAELALGQTDKALADIRMALYLADSVKDEPILISKLVRMTILRQALQTVWEGLNEHKWSDSELVELQQIFVKYNFVSEAADSFRSARALQNTWMDNFGAKHGNIDWQSNDLGRFRFLPKAFFYQNQLVVNRLFQDVSLQMVDPGRTLIHAERDDWNVMDREMKKYLPPYRIFARLTFPSIQKATIKFGYAQTMADEAAIACALERYRLAHNRLPDSLAELTPNFIKNLPHDVTTGEPFKYHRKNDGFILYSVGWNRKDDGGKVVEPKSSDSNAELNEKDWVWPQYQSKEAF